LLFAPSALRAQLVPLVWVIGGLMGFPSLAPRRSQAAALSAPISETKIFFQVMLNAKFLKKRKPLSLFLIVGVIGCFFVVSRSLADFGQSFIDTDSFRNVVINSAFDGSVKFLITGKDNSENNFVFTARDRNGLNILRIRNDGVVGVGDIELEGPDSYPGWGSDNPNDYYFLQTNSLRGIQVTISTSTSNYNLNDPDTWSITAAGVYVKNLTVTTTLRGQVMNLATITDFASVQADDFVGSVNASNVTSGVFGESSITGFYSFPGKLGVNTTTNSNLPQSLSVYGSGYFTSSSPGIGIGTPNPASAIDIAKSTATTLPAKFRFSPSESTYLSADADSSSNLFIGARTVSGSDGLRFYVSSDSSSVERMRVTTTSLGIGTQTPQGALGVAGSVSVGSNYANSASSSNGLVVEGSIAVFGTSTLAFAPGRVNVVSDLEWHAGGIPSNKGIRLEGFTGIEFGGANDSGVRFGAFAAGPSFGFVYYTTSAPDIYYDNLFGFYGGNWSIGPAPVGTAKVNVDGTIKTTGFQLGTSTTSGRVLTSDSSGVGTWQPALAGQANHPVKFTASGIGVSSSMMIYDDGSGKINIGSGNSPVGKLEITNNTFYNLGLRKTAGQAGIVYIFMHWYSGSFPYTSTGAGNALCKQINSNAVCLTTWSSGLTNVSCDYATLFNPRALCAVSG